jgi:hypothetical protein
VDDLIDRAILPHVSAPADAKPVLRITKNGPYIETQPTEEAFELPSGEYELFTRPAVELSDKPYQAAISCPHTIDNDRVVLEFDPKQPGHNALAQLALRLSAHAPTAVEYEIRGERAAQDAQWGGAAHDDAHDSGDFLEFIGNQAGKAIADYDKAADTPEAEAAAFRARFVKIAALANAAIESIDRKAKA